MTVMDLNESEVEVIDLIRLSPKEKLSRDQKLYQQHLDAFLANATNDELKEYNMIQAMSPEQCRVYSSMKLRESITSDLDRPEVRTVVAEVKAHKAASLGR